MNKIAKYAVTMMKTANQSLTQYMQNLESDIQKIFPGAHVEISLDSNHQWIDIIFKNNKDTIIDNITYFPIEFKIGLYTFNSEKDKLSNNLLPRSFQAHGYGMTHYSKDFKTRLKLGWRDEIEYKTPEEMHKYIVKFFTRIKKKDHNS